jgi:hypothetical protein
MDDSESATVYHFDPRAARRKALAFLPSMLLLGAVFAVITVAGGFGNAALDAIEIILWLLYCVAGALMFWQLSRKLAADGAAAFTVGARGVTLHPLDLSVAWTDLVEVRVHQTRLRLPERWALRSRYRRNLLFVVRDPVAALARVPAAHRATFARVLAEYGTPFAIPATLLDRPTDEVVEAIGRHVAVRWLDPVRARRPDE